ncbi:MAG: hypothetical protein CVU44_07475 [Chloroflexi bacterium HGW-Chloroflexi-6]|nr:MAG: hypothetical protein CVU44_07475 [Chloroflexi bacterium HGW-Chloroflexi-6]
MNKNKDINSDLEDRLRRITHQKWDNYKPAVSVSAIKRRSVTPFALSNPNHLMTRMALVSLFFCAFALFFYSPFDPPRLDGLQNMAAPIPDISRPTATPTLPSTATQKAGCNEILYTTQVGDTLESIAAKFSVAPDTIMADNQINTENMPAGLSLVISICQPATSTSTNEPTGTMTFAPQN